MKKRISVDKELHDEFSRITTYSVDSLIRDYIREFKERTELRFDFVKYQECLEGVSDYIIESICLDFKITKKDVWCINPLKDGKDKIRDCQILKALGLDILDYLHY